MRIQDKDKFMITDKINDTLAALPVIAASAVLHMPQTKDTPSHLPIVDFVHITSSARARSMKLEGLSVAQIALAMGMKTDEIWTYLQMPPMASGTFPVSVSP
jgi:hypothetical protein